MKIKTSEGVTIICCTDGLTIVMVAKDYSMLRTNGNEVLRNIYTSMDPVKRIRNRTRQDHNNNDGEEPFRQYTIFPVTEIDCLSLKIDRGMTFSNHLSKVCPKAVKTVKTVSTLLRNIGEAGSNKRRILAYTTQSVITYGAPVWVETLGKQGNKEQVLAVQRQMALRVAKVYRTTEGMAGMVMLALYQYN